MGVETTTRIATETVIGVMFSTALAVGSMITSGDELIEALFGGTRGMTTLEAALGLNDRAGFSNNITPQAR